jgi:nucleotide-binding universal stress UspA family protein
MTPSVGLVPLDGSATAECVLPWAGVLARALGLRLVLLQLVPEAWPGGDARAVAALRPAQHYLTGVAASLPADVAVETRAQPVGADVAAGVIGMADTEGAALILLASHGRSGLRRWVLGSVAEAVVRTARQPVLVVHAQPEGPPRDPPAVRRILLPLDGSVRAEAALPLAVQLAQAWHATLDLLEAVPWSWALLSASPEVVIPVGIDEQMEQDAAAYLQRTQAGLPSGVAGEHHIIRHDPRLAILDHLAETGADLVVMSTHGRSGLARFALGSVAETVLRGSTRPVLLVRAASASESETETPLPDERVIKLG